MECKDHWRYRRTTYYALNPMLEQTDLLGVDEGDYVNEGKTYPVIIRDDNIVEDALEYMFGEPEALVYPAKSYAIAMIYALFLATEFGGLHQMTPFDFLAQKDLLPGDPHFAPLTKDNKELYREIAKRSSDRLPWSEKLSAWGQKTLQYWKKEFMLDEDGLKILPRNRITTF